MSIKSIHTCISFVHIAIFHEGLKGWSCCKKRVASFDEFLQIPGCAKGHHSSEIKKAPEPEKSSKPLVEISNINNNVPQMVVQQLPRQQKANEKQEQEKQVYTEDTPDMVFTPGTICKRRGCGHKFKTSTISQGDGTEAICKYHDGTPVFHEVFINP